MSTPTVHSRIQALLTRAAIALAACIYLAPRAFAADAKPADLAKMQKALPTQAPATPAKPRKVLVYGNAQGFVHSSIPLGEKTIAALGEKTGAWTATISQDPAVFDIESLSQYDAVVLVSTTGHFLLPRTPDTRNMTPEQKQEIETQLKPYKDAERERMRNLLEFVRSGKGLAGIHAATDAYYDAPQYGEVMGGFFNGHPWNETVYIKIDDASSPLTTMFTKGEDLKIADEIYQFTSKGKNRQGQDNQTYSREKLHVLLSLDMSEGKTPRKNGVNPANDYGVAWIHPAGQGRVFYCSLGHREEIYWNPAVLKFYLAGIQYALGDLPADAAPSQPATK